MSNKVNRVKAIKAGKNLQDRPQVSQQKPAVGKNKPKKVQKFFNNLAERLEAERRHEEEMKEYYRKRRSGSLFGW